MSKKQKSLDGNSAAVHVAYAFSEVCAIYPITPSTPMGELMDSWAGEGRKNIFGSKVDVMEMQSEGGAAGAMHGILSGGALASTFTSSQGLLLMLPCMYKIAGELLPSVFHVAARALAGQALSIFGDHQDVMAARATGFAQLSSSSPQECMDLALVAHLSSLDSSIPFIHFFDGFRTSHEIQKVELIDYDEILPLVNLEAVKKHRARALNPDHPCLRGSAQNPDIYFQVTESAEKYYRTVPSIVEANMEKVARLTGRKHELFEYFGDPNAERVVIVMGSAGETLEETVSYLNKRKEKVGVLKVKLFRPFCKEKFLQKIPKSALRIAVLDRTKEGGALGEPLYLDVATSFMENSDQRLIVGGRYGLGSKDFTSAMAKAVFDNLKLSTPKNHFTVGIEDDVCHTSLNVEEIRTEPEDRVNCKFWGLGGDGTVGANKDAIKIIGDNSSKYVQGYFSYDSKKSGGVTISHLRFGSSPIKSTYLIFDADYIACHNPSFIKKFDVIQGLKKGGIFVLCSSWTLEEMEKELPAHLKRYLSLNDIAFYNIDAAAIAQKVGLGGKINMIMQSVFFKLSKVLEVDEAIRLLKEAIQKTYASKGEAVISKNIAAVDLGLQSLKKIDIPALWKEAQEIAPLENEKPDFIVKVVEPINAFKGDTLPVSLFPPGGTFPPSTTKYEKRTTALNLPKWIPENCIQCNLCSFVCPHAAIRPFLLTDTEVKSAPESCSFLKPAGKAFEGLKYSIAVSPEDCTGCERCVVACPATKGKALAMKPTKELFDLEKPLWDFFIKIPEKSELMNKYTVKGSQFKKPLLEFSGACAGCGETPCVKLLTQLFGNRMIIANATGCSSIWGGSTPSIPWTIDSKGHGPAWANSLFEDNAEFGFGIALSYIHRRAELREYVLDILKTPLSTDLKTALEEWISFFSDGEKSRVCADKLKEILKREQDLSIKSQLSERSDLFVKPSIWIVGGDGWAYDIGYGGLDHVLAQSVDLNILVLDTEVYSNTGGQASKATQLGATAKFASLGKRSMKKELGLMALIYGHVYVAQVAMGYDEAQFVKALKEAESYPGPSLVIAYASCINQGLLKGLAAGTEGEKMAVESGYWINYHYDPRLKAEGKPPLQLDMKEPTVNVDEFLKGQLRFESLRIKSPELAKQLQEELKTGLKKRYEFYKQLSSSL